MKYFLFVMSAICLLVGSLNIPHPYTETVFQQIVESITTLQNALWFLASAIFFSAGAVVHSLSARGKSRDKTSLDVAQEQDKNQ